MAVDLLVDNDSLSKWVVEEMIVLLVPHPSLRSWSQPSHVFGRLVRDKVHASYPTEKTGEQKCWPAQYSDGNQFCQTLDYCSSDTKRTVMS